jgi:hypothetical protein
MNQVRYWGRFLCLAAVLSVSPSYAQDADEAADPAIDAAEGDVLVQKEPGRPGVIKITYICRDHKAAVDREKKAGKPAPAPAPAHISDCEGPATGFAPWGYTWPRTLNNVPFTKLPFDLYTLDSGIDPDNALAALLSAFSSWVAAEAVETADSPDVRPPSVIVTHKSAVVRAPSTRRPDGVNVINWGSLSGGTLAVTQIWISGSTILECDMTFNRNYAWKTYPGPIDPATCGTLGSQYDLEHIAAHECGHAYGMSHPVGSDGRLSTANPRLTMYYAGGPGELHNRTLNLGDIAGIQAIY